MIQQKILIFFLSFELSYSYILVDIFLYSYVR